jgi:DeoR/GlpR family transcriptional regulator of sugar metabolism
MRWFIEYRMRWIADRLRKHGHIRRGDLVAEFGMSTPQASVDLRTYSEQNPGSIAYNLKTKRYEAVNP